VIVSGKRNFKTASGGFTLVELMVAAAVLAITMMLTYGVYASMFSVVDHVQRRGSAKRSALLFFDQLQRDIYGMYKGPSAYFKAEEPLSVESGAPFLQFSTSSRLYFEDRPFIPALIRVSYTIKKAGNGSIFDIYRTEFRFESLGSSETEKAQEALRVGEGVRALSLRYKGNADQFFDQWEMGGRGDNGSFDDGRFPSLIRVEFGRADGDEGGIEPQLYRSSISVPVAGLSFDDGSEGS
jgi:prepilin-type N-terminal cleavage/methylation domain-containing protein